MSQFAYSNKTKQKLQCGSRWVEINWRRRQKTIRLVMQFRKPIRVLVPSGVPEAYISNFVLENEVWIKTQELIHQGFEDEEPQRKIKIGGKLLFMGKEYPLKFVSAAGIRDPYVSVSEDHLLMHIPNRHWSYIIPDKEYPLLMEYIRKFYRRECIRIMTERIKYWSEQMQIFPTTVGYREPKDRWGSCKPALRRLNFNWRVVVFGMDAIDYMIVHELSHIVHPNHSEEFWHHVGRYVPHFKLTNEMLDTRKDDTMFLIMPHHD